MIFETRNDIFRALNILKIKISICYGIFHALVLSEKVALTRNGIFSALHVLEIVVLSENGNCGAFRTPSSCIKSRNAYIHIK